MNVTHIELHFENLESVKFRIEDVVHMYFGEIKKQISSFGHTHVMEMEIADDFRLQVNARGNTQEAYECTWKDEGDDTTPFTRVNMYPDITSVDLRLADGTKREIYIDWQGTNESDYENQYQTSTVSDANGDLFVIVNAKEDVETAFGESIDDENPFYRRVIEIKDEGK